MIDLDYIQKHADGLIKLRLSKELALSDDYIERLLSERVTHPLVSECLSWQGEDGYFGHEFHGGWLPANPKIRSSRSMETAMRFLAEASYTKEDHVIKMAMKSLLSDGFNRSYSSWDSYNPLAGFYGDDYERCYLMALFSIEGEYDYFKRSINDALEAFDRLAGLALDDDFFDIIKGKRVVRKGASIPDLYQLRLLAYTKKWRSPKNLLRVRRGLERWLAYGSLPSAYGRIGHQLVALATMAQIDIRKSIDVLNDEEWYMLLSTLELLGRLGMLDLPLVSDRVCELKNYMDEHNGLMMIDAKHKRFKVWGAYSGMRLSRDWRAKSRICDLSFRVHEILSWCE